MKTGLSLTQLAHELEARSNAKADYVAHTTQVSMTGDGHVRFVNGSEHVLSPNEIAHRQIGERIGIPAKYYDRMLSKSPELLASNVNHWLHEEPETRMLRTLNGSLRAFLSDRYQRIENEEIAQVVLPVLLSSGDDIRVESCEITERRMYIKAVFPKIQGEVRKGDVVQSGVVISNSEVGLGAVKIEPLVFRLVCLNGMIANDRTFAARHVGGAINAGETGINELLTDEARQADDKAILLKVRDVVQASLSQVHFENLLTRMRASTEDRIEGNPAETVKVLAKKQGLNQFEEGSILRHLIEGSDLSRWGVLNAVTRTAQDVASYDRATELEALGGIILDLPKAEWRVLAEAA